MASDNHPLTLMNIPLEVRHQIFEYVAVRDTQPKKLLRYWFEKEEAKEKKAELAMQDPSAPVPMVVFEGDGFELEEEAEEEGDSEDEEGEEDSDEEVNNGEEEEEDDDDDDDDDGEDETEDEESEEEEQQDDDDDDDEDIAEQDEDDDIPMPVITTHRKWRHIPKQLNDEAKGWFYDVAVLRIDATGSFAHTSFFEEAFGQITETNLSPVKNIRKVEVAFIWDTTWLRADDAGCAGAIFPALLRQRAAFVVGILAQAPNLKEVTIHWHDSAQDKDSIDLMNDVLMGFLNLSAKVEVKTQYIAPDAKPRKKSIAGRRRLNFQSIVSNGLDRLF
ncbi:hypothetical protein N0V94_009440 [Neodidymelliopsis sp. IMI 364377]|nr:hypothetical protein N0V94_009440 [Neodidymelliopsis sp. IMI 364377]